VTERDRDTERKKRETGTETCVFCVCVGKREIVRERFR